MNRKLALLGTTAALLLTAGAGTASAHHYDGLLAPKSVCADQENTAASVGVQERAMRCMHNHARDRRNLSALASRKALAQSAGGKANDIYRCQDFSHNACGRDTFYWLRRVGYASGCWGAGENIAWGSGSLGSVRSIMSAWLHSDGHRNNILRSRYRDQGVGLVKGTFRGYSGAQVWVAHLGYRC